jgi:UDP-N-acetylglucosamine acyltransferase
MANKIHPTAIVSDKAILGDNNVIGPYSIIYDNVEIGSNNIIVSHASVGSPAEHRTSTQLSNGVVIGSNNFIREFVTINSGTKSITTIKDNNYLMRNSHVGHDAEIGSHCNIACNAIIGGHTILMDFCNLGLGAILHQNLILPPGCMIGMGGVATKTSTFKPFHIYVGNPVRQLSKNVVGMQRLNITDFMLHDFEADYLQMLIKRRMSQ